MNGQVDESMNIAMLHIDDMKQFIAREASGYGMTGKGSPYLQRKISDDLRFSRSAPQYSS
jgi:hypothetical protein